MKHPIFLLLALAAMAVPGTALAVDYVTDTIPIGGTIIIRHPRPVNRPNSVVTPDATAGIYCTYGRGWLKLELPRGVYSATVTLTSATYQWNGLATTDQPYTEIPELEGRYTIVLRTDDSQTYSGSIEF